jgi:CheY-like chemotaxis protein
VLPGDDIVLGQPTTNNQQPTTNKQQRMTIAYVTNDLLFASPVKGVAERLGQELEVVGTLDALLEQAKESPLQLVLIDLSAPGIDPRELVEKLRAATLDSPPKLVAYAPHVHETKLAAATDAGCDEVLTRGQFHGQIERVLTQYGGRGTND